MYSLMYKYIEDILEIWRKFGKAHSEDSIEDVFSFLTSQVDRTGNYFTELVDIAVLVKKCNSIAISQFRHALKAKIIEQRGEVDGQILINKFI